MLVTARCPERHTLLNFLLDLADESQGEIIGVAAGAKRVAPLLVREPCEHPAGPDDILRSQILEQLAMPRVIVEEDMPIPDPFHEFLTLEVCDPVPRPHREAG